MDAARRIPPRPTTASGFEAVVRDPCHARHFRDDAVPREDVEHMVDLAMCAASTCSAQAWRFLAVQDPELIGAMRAAVLERFEELALTPGLALQEHKRTAARAQALLFAKAPLCIAVLALALRFADRGTDGAGRNDAGGARPPVRATGAPERRSRRPAAHHVRPLPGVRGLLDLCSDRGRRTAGATAAGGATGPAWWRSSPSAGLRSSRPPPSGCRWSRPSPSADGSAPASLPPARSAAGRTRAARDRRLPRSRAARGAGPPPRPGWDRGRRALARPLRRQAACAAFCALAASVSSACTCTRAEVDGQRPVGEVRPLAERHLEHEHRHDAHEVDDVHDVGRLVEAEAVQAVLQHAGHRHPQQQVQEHPVALVRVLVLRQVLLQPAADVQDHGDDQADRGQVAERVHAPVDRRPRLHLVQEEHDEHQHRDVAQHEREVDRPRALALALAVLGLREELVRQLRQGREVRADAGARVRSSRCATCAAR